MTTPSRVLGALIATLCAGLLTLAGAAQALTLVPLDLAQLTDGAGRIFVGQVERVDAGHDANGMPAVWTTFRVDTTVKGTADAHVTLKQLGTAFGGGTGRVLPHPGLPRYQPGEAVVLFVHPESPLGFTSPVGLGQGCFRIHERDGRRVVENDLGNRNLAMAASRASARGTTSPAASAPVAEPLPLDTLLERVRARIWAAP